LGTRYNYASSFSKELDSDINMAMEKFDCIGLSVVVVKKNDIFHRKSYGYNPDYNDESKHNSIPNNGIFWWASVSKTFISTAIMQLKDSGVVSLYDDVNNYLDFNVRNPKYPETPITIQMLLCHRSSLNDTKYRWGFKMLHPDKNKNYGETYNSYKPGDGFDYCNLNYNLLAAIIEKATGERFDKYIKNNICNPLGISGSFNKLDLDSSLFVKTYCYDQKARRYEKYHPYRRRSNCI